MTARTRSVLSPVLLLALALALAYALSLIPTLGLAHGAAAAGVVEAAAPVAVPQIAPPPAPLPEPTVDEIAALWSSGAPFAALLVGLYLGLLALARFDPGRALKWTGSAGAVGLLVEAVRAGAAPSLSVILSALSVIAALWLPGSKAPSLNRPTSLESSRDLERGSALLGLLAQLAACALVVAAAGHLWSCSGAKATTADVGACSAAQAGPLVDDVQQLISDNTDEAGHINWQHVEDGLRARLLRYGREVVTCAVRRAIDRMLATPTLVRVDRAELELGWVRLRDGVLAGAEVR
ncbi:MAG TPA: hypothetical protein VFO62_10445 [Candidatus Binatia bacterium]|nr:hypothetical protein [Candidatus Binatia bacterium]